VTARCLIRWLHLRLSAAKLQSSWTLLLSKLHWHDAYCPLVPWEATEQAVAALALALALVVMALILHTSV